MAHSAEELPSHASPMISPVARPSAGYLSNWNDLQEDGPPTPGFPNNLISPAFTPPATPGAGTPSRHLHAEPKSIPVDTSLDEPSTKQPRLVQNLPNVECLNDSDNKEHLAIVFGNSIRSRSLDAERPGETEMDRMIRGAYTGRLRPGRTSSRIDPDSSRRPFSKRARSGSALKNVTTVPEEGVLETEPETLVQLPAATQDEQNSEQIQDHATGLEPLLESVQLTVSGKAPLVRIHSECYTGETAWSARCDCGEQLDEAARLMSLPSSPGGVIVYLRQEGRGIGLASKLKAYNLQDLGNDTVEANLLLRHPADARTYGLATAILQDLGLGTDSDGQKAPEERGIRLLTNNPDKVRAVEGPNKEVRVRERVAMIPIAWRTSGAKGVRGAEIEKYLETKIGRMGHMIREE
ncbi:GTP cyclohydrolase II [Exophiala xenobiotica]